MRRLGETLSLAQLTSWRLYAAQDQPHALRPERILYSIAVAAALITNAMVGLATGKSGRVKPEDLVPGRQWAGEGNPRQVFDSFRDMYQAARGKHADP